MKLPKIVRQRAPLIESLLFIALFCSLLGCTSALIDYLDSERSPRATLRSLNFFKKTAQNHLLVPAPQALFDGQTIKKTILGFLDKAQPQDEVFITTFIMTDGDIAQAIIKKHRQGVAITIVADSSHAQKDYSKVPDLIKTGIPVYLHNPDSPDIMHNKFWVFAFNQSEPVALTGSYNPTNSAATKNAENIVLIAHSETILEYKKHFEKLLKNSVRAPVAEPKRQTQKIDPKVLDAILKANGLAT